MAKFNISLEFEKFKLVVNGEREDIPAITRAVKQQLGSLAANPELLLEAPVEPTLPPAPEDGGNGKPRRKRNPSARASADGGTSQPIEFRHDPEKYGNPQQDWTVTDKCIWLLYVLQKVTSTKEVSGAQLAATWNTHFKRAGRIHPPHTSTNLGAAKVQTPAPVQEDKGLWYLTETGERQAQELIRKALNPSA